MFEGWGAAAVGAAVVGGVVASNSASKAADAQTAAGEASNATQLQMYNQTRDDQAPYRAAGTSALSQLSDLTKAGGEFNHAFTAADLQADPGYAFRQQQGQRGLEASAAARGGLLSGGAGKDLVEYGQNFASQEYGNAYNRYNNDLSGRFNRLASLAGLGQTATNQVGAAGQNAANNIGNVQTQVGNAQAANSIAQGNAVNGAIGTIGNWWQQRPSNPSTSFYSNTNAPVGTNGQGNYDWLG